MMSPAAPTPPSPKPWLAADLAGCSEWIVQASPALFSLDQEQLQAWFEVDGFYWTVLVPDIVNSGREEQGSVSV